MRGPTRAVVLLASATMLAALAGPGTASAAAPGHVTSVAADAGPFTVDGVVGHADATISVIATDDRGRIGACDAGDLPEGSLIQVWLQRTSGGPADIVSTYLTSSSIEADGEHWSGTWRIGSTRGGTWVVTRIWWCTGMDDFAVDPRTLGLTATIDVVGTHVPTATYAYVPAVAPYGGRQWLIATYSDGYGDALAHYPMLYGRDDLCSPLGRSQLFTDSSGRLTVRVRRDVQQCLAFTYPGTSPIGAGSTVLDDYWLAGPMYYASVTIAASSAVVRAGRAVTIAGTIAPRARAKVALQRLVGRTWRTVSVLTQRPSGHVTFTYRPTSVGRVYLRLSAQGSLPGQGSFATTTSRPLVLTVVRR